MHLYWLDPGESLSFLTSFSAAVNSETREEVAIKKIGSAFDNRIDAKRTLREIKLLQLMDHENVITFLTLMILCSCLDVIDYCRGFFLPNWFGFSQLSIWIELLLFLVLNDSKIFETYGCFQWKTIEHISFEMVPVCPCVMRWTGMLSKFAISLSFPWPRVSMA